MSALRIPTGMLVVLAATASVAPVAMAADWQVVVTGKYETIEIDRARIVRGDKGATGWSRVRLDRDVKDPGGVYDTIHAQNQYDCEARRFTTLRRAYYKGDTLVREEGVARQRANAIAIGSIDERLFNEACRTPSEAVLVADAAGAEKPAPMHADMRTLAGEARARVVPVADAVTKPVAPPAAPAAAAPAPAPAGADKPRRIALPAIDKAAADAAAAAALGTAKGSPAAAAAASPAAPARPAAAPVPAVAAPAAAKPAVPPGLTSAATGTSPAAKAPAPASAPAPSVAASAVPSPSPAATEVAEPTDRRLRELQYATTGPRRVVRKPKPAEPPAPAYPMHIHWSYEGEGAPANWARLRPEYGLCGSGKRQSPIDLRDGIRVDLETIKFDYKPSHFRIIDNGHTVSVTAGEGLGLSLLGKRYELEHIHFHRPAEERVNGRTYDMSAHLVHRNLDGQIAVVAVLMEKGGEHPVIQTLWNHMPLEKDMEVMPADTIDVAKLLPENRAYWTYMGSLTTPPCTEGVQWLVLKQPIQVSPEQIAIFARLYRNNARPVQPTHGRLIKESR